MTHISRPFQIALVAIALFVVVWFVALRGHSAGSAGAGSSPSAPSAAAPAKPTSGTPSPQGSNVYHGSAPGVSGLTRAIAKARGAVAQSQQNAQRLHHKVAQASSSSAAQHAGTSSSAASAPAAPGHAAAPKSSTAPTNTGAAKSSTAPASVSKPSSSAKAPSSKGSPAGSAATPSMQGPVETELKQGKLVAILFWNPKGADDVSVRRELQAVGHSLKGTLVVHIARASQVGSFGSFTRTAQVYGTPTILLVNTKGQTSTLTGLTDAFSIKQAIQEAKQAR